MLNKNVNNNKAKIIEKKSFFFNYLTFKVVSNNMFFNLNTLKYVDGGKYQVGNSLLCTNSGRLKQKLSKKNLKHYLNSFFSSIKKEFFLKKILRKNIWASVVAPKRLRKRIFFLVKYYYRKKKRLIEMKHKKIFNGCRPKKNVRKKRKVLRKI